MLVSLTDIYGQYTDACLPYRYIRPVYTCLSPLPIYTASIQMLVSLTDIHGQYTDACLPYRYIWPVYRCLSPLPALLTSMWIFLSERSRSCAQCRTDSSDAKSSFTTTNWPTPSLSFVSRRMSVAASSAFFRSLHAMITRAPVVQKYRVGYFYQVKTNTPILAQYLLSRRAGAGRILRKFELSIL